MNAQRAFTQQVKRQPLHTEVAKLFIDQQPLDMTIERLGQLLCKQLELCTVALYTQDSNNSAALSHYYTLINNLSGNNRLHWQHGFLDWYEQLENHQTVLIDIERCDHHRAQFLRSLNINSGVLCPMRVNAQWVGFLLFGSKDKDSLKHRYNADLLNDISEMCSSRLSAQLQTDQRQQSLQRVQALERITHSFNQNAVDSVSIERAVTEVRETFDADRAWLLNPELIDDKHVEVAYEVSAPEWPGSKTLNEPLEIDDDIAGNIALLESRDLPITFGSGNEHPLPNVALRYGVQSQVVMLLRPSTGDPWVLGLDHCRSKRYWTNNEQLLFRDIGHRITEHLSQNLLLQQVADSENKFRTLFNETPSIFITLNKNHRLTSINRYGVSCLKAESARLKGKLFYELFDDEYRDGVLTYLEWANHGSPTTGTDLQSTEAKLTLANREERWLKITARKMPDATLDEVLVVAEDITAQRRLTEALAQQAHKDPLTGLANRREFRAQLDQAFSARHAQAKALCYIDLNGFKKVNDTFGHEVGDALLEKLGQLLRKNTRDQDLVARLGGDEFCLLAQDATAEKVTYLANKLSERISQNPITIGQQAFHLSASIGVALSSDKDGTPADWLRRADAACYYAKTHATSEPIIYEDLPEKEQRTLSVEAGYWETLIRQLIRENGFNIHLQPVMDTRDDAPSLSHYEALIRLPKEHSEIKIEDFFRQAKRANLTREVDYWVLNTVIKALSKDPAIHSEVAHVSVNLCADTILHRELSKDIQRMMSKHNIAPQRLCLELKEEDVLSHFNAATNLFEALANTGVKFCVDHFGYNLQAVLGLQKLPFDYIKLDGHLINNLNRSPVNATVVAAILKISKIMGARTIAGHVEQANDLKALQKLGVDYAQGFALGRPEPMQGNATLLH